MKESISMKIVLKIFLYYALIPFCASLPGFFLNLCGLFEINVMVVPALAAAIYLLLRNRIDMVFAAKTNGVTVILLIAVFTIMMFLSSGNMEGILMTNFCWLVFPFAPLMLVYMLMGQNLLLYVTAFLTYAAAFAVTASLAKMKWKKVLAPVLFVLVCIVTSTILYHNRPSVKYGGHGFEYMHGFSSTDFSDYMVYSRNSRLVTLEQESSLIIENEEDMPVLDGAEACYPLYAAFAKAVYKDIGRIEEKWLEGVENPVYNGKIVTFTNSVFGFGRLLRGGEDPGKFGEGIDMFFGAGPSASQLEEARECGVELEITPIGREAFVFFVEKDNPVDNLTSEQLRSVYHGDITNWCEVSGKNQKILAFQRPKDSGSQTMMEYFMGDVPLKEPQTYERVSAMEGVVREVAQYTNERGAIGYSFRYFLEELNQEKDVKILSVDGVYPTLENIENGSYPLIANVCLITRKDDPNLYVQKMKEFILSEEGQEIIKRTGYAGID